MLLLQPSARVRAQGCVASRGGACFHLPGMELQPQTGFQATFGYRWLHSDRHFVGDHEETHRQEEGSEVINDSHYVDLGLSYAITPRYGVNLVIPFSFNDRSQVVRSNDVQRTILQRFATQSYGLGDIRLTGNAWVLDRRRCPRLISCSAWESTCRPARRTPRTRSRRSIPPPARS